MRVIHLWFSPSAPYSLVSSMKSARRRIKVPTIVDRGPRSHSRECHWLALSYSIRSPPPPSPRALGLRRLARLFRPTGGFYISEISPRAFSCTMRMLRSFFGLDICLLIRYTLWYSEAGLGAGPIAAQLYRNCPLSRCVALSDPRPLPYKLARRPVIRGRGAGS